MAIKNYTTKISAAQTVGEIQAILAAHGVRVVWLEYDGNGGVIGVSFRAMTPYGERGFRLPARVDRMCALLKKQKVKSDPETAARVAWRNIKDWIDSQMAMIEVELVTIDEVFLPYMIDQKGVTLYETFSTGAALEAGDE